MKTPMEKHYDVIVIGSGFGGAASAAKLAKSGMKVCILEKGIWWGKAGNQKPFPENPFGVARALHTVQVANSLLNRTLTVNRQGLYEMQFLKGWNLINGVGVGGSSLIYGGITHRPAEDFFDVFPDEITWAEMEPYFCAVEKILQPSVSKELSEKTPHYARIFDEFDRARFSYLPQAVTWGEGKKADHEVENDFGVKQKNCIFCNQCMGCNRGSKNSLDLNMLAGAVADGAEIRTHCDVRVIYKLKKGYKVEYRNLKTKEVIFVSSSKVVLAAGTVNTHRILFRSRSATNGLPELSPTLGEKISLGGDSMRFMPVRKKFDWRSGHLVEAAMEVLDEKNRRDFMVFPGEMFFYNKKSMRIFRSVLDRTWLLTGFGRDLTDGKFNWDGRQLNLEKPDQEIIGKIYSCMDKLAEHYSRKKIKPRRDNDRSPRPRKGIISFHPMGGCNIGKTIDNGVVDQKGEVFRYPGLYVVDASIFAGPPVSAPSLTVAAMALRISDLIVSQSK